MKQEPRAPDNVFDARGLPCDIKRPALIQRCLELAVGQALVFVNQHDPVPVRASLDAAFPGCFCWEPPVEVGDAGGGVSIRVTKLAPLPEGTVG